MSNARIKLNRFLKYYLFLSIGSGVYIFIMDVIFAYPQSILVYIFFPLLFCLPIALYSTWKNHDREKIMSGKKS